MSPQLQDPSRRGVGRYRSEVFSLHSPEYDERRDGYLPFGPAGAASDPLQPVCIGSGRSAWHKPRRRRSTSSRVMTGIGSEDVAASANSAAADLSSLGSAP